MAISPKNKYPTQIDLTDPLGYPEGKARNVTVSGDGTGTPLEKDLVNDIFGFQQELLSKAGITPSGIPDKVGSSQYKEALDKLYRFKNLTTLELISNPSLGVPVGQIIETVGFYSVGDGGGGTWKKTGNIIALSQTPALTGNATLSDANGNEFELVGNVTVKKLGSTGDGVTDDTKEINSSHIASPVLVDVPESLGTYKHTDTAFTLSGNFDGEGQIETVDGKRGRKIRRLAEPPTTLSNGGGLNSFYANDFPFPDVYDIAVTGLATIGNPATGYAQYDQTTPFFTGAYFSSGHNESTTTADGRTGWAIDRKRLTANGNGDQFCQNWNAVITNNNPLHTGLFGKPAAGFWNGNLTAAVDSVYFNPVEYNLEDKGFDVRSAGLVVNHKRDNNTATFGEWWCGTRHQSTGTVSADAAYQLTGGWNVGFDATPAAGNTVKAIALSEGQEIHYDATAATVGGAKTYATSFGGTKTSMVGGIWQFSHKGTIVTSVGTTMFDHPNRILGAESLATSLLEVTTTQVLTSQDSVVFVDATTPTNPTYTLPLVSAYSGKSGRITIKRTGGGGTVTIQRQGTNNIIDKTGSSITSFTVAANEAVELVCDSSNWHILYIL